MNRPLIYYTSCVLFIVSVLATAKTYTRHLQQHHAAKKPCRYSGLPSRLAYAQGGLLNIRHHTHTHTVRTNVIFTTSVRVSSHDDITSNFRFTCVYGIRVCLYRQSRQKRPRARAGHTQDNEMVNRILCINCSSRRTHSPRLAYTDSCTYTVR